MDYISRFCVIARVLADVCRSDVGENGFQVEFEITNSTF